MAIDGRLSQREYDKFRESTATANQVAVKVVNPDGSNVAGGASDTELPAAAVAADNFANPTTTNLMAMGMQYDGSAWDRARGDSTNGLLVNLGTNNDVGLNAGTNNVGYVSMFRRSDAIQGTITSADASSATQVIAKVAAKNIYVTDVIISTDTAMNIQLQDDAGSPAVLMEQIYVPANSVFSKSFTTPLMVATNQDLDVIASASGNISVTVTGYQV